MCQLRRSADDLNVLNRTIPANVNVQHDRALDLLLSSVFRILRFDAVKQTPISRRRSGLTHCFRLFGRGALQPASQPR